jgi:hypothetical protein
MSKGMTIEEAIEELKFRKYAGGTRNMKALQLGIEALEREKSRREAELALYPLNGFRPDWLLPSEKEE